MNATVNAIRTTEKGLLSAITNAADALDRIATDELGNALANLQESADRAQARLQAVALRYNAILQGVLLTVEGIECGILAGMEEDDTPVSPVEPVALPAVETPALPEPVETVEEAPAREDSLGSLWFRDLIAALKTVPENAPADVAEATPTIQDKTPSNGSCDASDASQEAPLPVPDAPAPGRGKAKSRRRKAG